jgi:plastocyanin
MPALAADDATVTASDFAFTPREVRVSVGNTVTFANSEGLHNFSFADGQEYPADPEPPGSAWDGRSRTFTQAGTYAYRCEAHAAAYDMRGVITVVDGGGDTDPAPTPTPTPMPGPPPTPQPGGGPGGDGSTAVEIRTLRPAGTTFCIRRSRTCRRPGVRLRIDLSRAATVTGTLRRRPPRGARRARRFGRVSLGTVAAGARTLRFSRTAGGRRLTPGRYTLALTIGDAAPRTVRFKVR